MRFVLLLIAAVSAVQLEKGTESPDTIAAYRVNMAKAADAQHKVTMGTAKVYNDLQKAGVAAGEADTKAYLASHR